MLVFKSTQDLHIDSRMECALFQQALQLFNNSDLKGLQVKLLVIFPVE